MTFDPGRMPPTYPDAASQYQLPSVKSRFRERDLGGWLTIHLIILVNVLVAAGAFLPIWGLISLGTDSCTESEPCSLSDFMSYLYTAALLGGSFSWLATLVLPWWRGLRWYRGILGGLTVLLTQLPLLGMVGIFLGVLDVP